MNSWIKILYRELSDYANKESQMETNMLQRAPFNIDILKVQDNDLPRLGQITELTIFDNQGNFHPQGLFSTTVFGQVGSEFRNRTFAYIDLKIPVLHPFIYYTVINLKSFYKQIAEGKVTAIFDHKSGEFIKSSDEGASTGYHFFYSHIPELKFEKNDSEKRNFLVDLFNLSIKADTYKMKYLLVLPAGLRDYTVDSNGKPQEDEVNTYYRKILAQSSIIDIHSVKKAPEVYDNVAIGIQNLSLELFEYIKSLLEGKNKLILGKWLTRKIFNSTRNVLSSSIDKVDNIDNPNRLKYNECLVGIHQFTRAAVPRSTYEIINKYIRNIFIPNSTTAYLTNVKTLKKEEVLNTHIQKEYDLWTSSDGIDKVIATLGNLNNRNEPILLNKGKHYMGLMYKDKQYFKFIQDIDELPEGYSRDNVTPVTLAEFIYISVYELSGQYPGFVTRYPITGFGSIYPCYVKLTTTTETYSLEELNENWEPSGKIAYSFPNINSQYFNTCAVHPSHLGALGGDFDGDTVSLTMALTDEAISEIKDYLNKKEYYFNDNGGFTFSSSVDTLDAVLSYMTA